MEDAFLPLALPHEPELHFYTALGRALYVAQHLEMNCRAVVAVLRARMLVVTDVDKTLEDGSFSKALSKLWRQTLGEHVRYLSAKLPPEMDVSATLSSAVSARNEIVHWVAIGLELDEEPLETRTTRIRELVRTMASADKLASGMVHALNGDPLPVGDYLSTYEDRVVRWVCATLSEPSSPL